MSYRATTVPSVRSKTEVSGAVLSRAGLLVVSAYIAAQILSDIGSLKIALFAGFSIDGGTFIYPVTFTLRDMVHKLLGRRAARTLVITAGVINLLMAAYFLFVAALPADPAWLSGFAAQGIHADPFALVLSPTWRIVIASIIAEVVSELLDTEIYHLWVTRITRRYQWARVLVSNTISVPVDSLIFCWGAFAGRLPPAVIWSIFWINVITKGLTTLVSLPGIYLVREEGEA